MITWGLFPKLYILYSLRLRVVKSKQDPLFDFELQIANNYANIFEDVKTKIIKLKIHVQKWLILSCNIF